MKHKTKATEQPKVEEKREQSPSVKPRPSGLKVKSQLTAGDGATGCSDYPWFEPTTPEQPAKEEKAKLTPPRKESSAGLKMKTKLVPGEGSGGGDGETGYP